MIEISPAAISEIKRMQALRVQPTSKFQIGFASGGCQDFYYTIDLVAADREQFDRERIYDINGISVSIVGGSAAIDLDQQLNYLDSLKLDYSEDLMGGGFRFQNSLTSSVCGCGNSFSIANNTESARWQLPT